LIPLACRPVAKQGETKLVEIAAAIAACPRARTSSIYDHGHVRWLPYRSKGPR
jgi:hypothetical protein